MLKTKGKVTTKLILQQFTFTCEFHILAIPGCEVVLHTAWLKTLGDKMWNFEKMSMKFKILGTSLIFKG